MIGKTINKLLTEDNTLANLVGAKIYPYAIPVDTNAPTVVWVIDSVEPEYNKGAWSGDIVEFSVYSVSDLYSQLQDVTKAVRDAVEMKKAGYGKEIIDRIEMIGLEEELDGSTFKYISKLSFNVKVKGY